MSSASADPVTAQTVRNSAALRDLMRGALLAQGADTLADTPVSAWQDGVAARKAMAAAMDTEMRAAPTDEAYQAWATLRAALYDEKMPERPRHQSGAFARVSTPADARAGAGL